MNLKKLCKLLKNTFKCPQMNFCKTNLYLYVELKSTSDLELRIIIIRIIRYFNIKVVISKHRK